MPIPNTTAYGDNGVYVPTAAISGDGGNLLVANDKALSDALDALLNQSAGKLNLSGGTLSGQLTGPGGNTFDDGYGNFSAGYGTFNGVQTNNLAVSDQFSVDSFGDVNASGTIFSSGGISTNGSASFNQFSGNANGQVYFDAYTNLHLNADATAWAVVDDSSSTNLFVVNGSNGGFGTPSSVITKYNTLDDGSGNSIVSGNLVVLTNATVAGTLLAGGTLLAAGARVGTTTKAQVGGSLFETNADVQSTTSTSLQTLVSHTIPAGELTNNKDKLRTTIAFTTANNAHTKSVLLTAFGTTVWTQSLTTSTAGVVVLDCLIIRVSASAVRCVVYPTMATTAGATNPTITDISGLTLSNTGTLSLTCTIGTGAAAGDVTAKMDVVEYLPYSGN